MQNSEIKLALPSWEEMPDIGLYMDQVLVLMDKYMGNFLACLDKESFLTPAMINNYVKHGIMPAPESKRYSKEHLAYLIIICLMKQSLSISSIKEITDIQLKKIDIVTLYDKFCSLYIKALNEVLRGKDISLNFEDKNDSILNLGIISNVCTVVSEKELFRQIDKNKKIEEISKKEKKEKKKEEKKKEENK